MNRLHSVLIFTCERYREPFSFNSGGYGEFNSSWDSAIDSRNDIYRGKFACKCGRSQHSIPHILHTRHRYPANLLFLCASRPSFHTSDEAHDFTLNPRHDLNVVGVDHQHIVEEPDLDHNVEPRDWVGVGADRAAQASQRARRETRLGSARVGWSGITREDSKHQKRRIIHAWPDLAAGKQRLDEGVARAKGQ